MAARNISFNGNALQSDHIFVTDIDDVSAPTRELSIYKLGHANASKIPYDQYSGKNITISGTIYGDNIIDLDGRIDTFKGYFNGVDKYLDVDYNNNTRRYTATMQAISISRPGGLAYATFTVNFVCTQPFGQDITTTVLCNYTARQLFTAGSSGSFANSTGIGSIGAPSVLGSTTTQHWEGTRALIITTTGTGANAQQGATQTASITSVIGTVYTFSAYFKAAVGVPVTIRLGDSVGNTDTTTVGTGDWFRISVTRTAAATTIQPYLLVNNANAVVYTAYFDAAQLEAGTSPSTFFDNHALVNFSAQNDTFTFGGTAPIQYPIISITFTTLTTGIYTFTFGNNTNGQQVTLNRTWTVSDVLVIDSLNRIVTINGIEIDFVGAFPEFAPGVGVLGITGAPSGATLNYKVEYYPRYL